MTDEERALYQEAAKEVLRASRRPSAEGATDWHSLEPVPDDPDKSSQVMAALRLATSIDRLSDTIAGVLDALSDWAKSKE